MAGQVFLVAEQREGHVKRVTLEILSELLRQGADPTVIVLGAGELGAVADELGALGASRVVFLRSEALGQYSTEGFANALHAYLAPLEAGAVFTGATALAKDFLPRLAAKLGVGMGSDCVEFKMTAGQVMARRPMFAGKCSKAVQFLKTPALLSIRPNVFPVGQGQKKSAQVETQPANVGEIRTKLVEVKAGGAKKVDLTEADIIISGGRLLKSADNFKILQDCAAVVGAAVGASRAAVDAGYAPHDMQVGQTGKTVSPKLYIACGISGAIQHLAGMRTSKVIVAINKDPDAPIFQKADYGLVADLFEAVPLLTEELKKLKAGS